MKIRTYLFMTLALLLGACTTNNYITKGYNNDDVYYSTKKSNDIVKSIKVDTSKNAIDFTIENNYNDNYYDINDLDYTYRINRFYRPYYDAFYWNDWFWNDWQYPYSFWGDGMYYYNALNYPYNYNYGYGIYYNYNFWGRHNSWNHNKWNDKWDHKWNDKKWNDNGRNSISSYGPRRSTLTDKPTGTATRSQNLSPRTYDPAQKLRQTESRTSTDYTRSSNIRSSNSGTNRISPNTSGASRIYTPNNSETRTYSAPTQNRTTPTQRSYSAPAQRSYSAPPTRSSSSFGGSSGATRSSGGRR